jgi:hypothetical protein
MDRIDQFLKSKFFKWLVDSAVDHEDIDELVITKGRNQLLSSRAAVVNIKHLPTVKGYKPTPGLLWKIGQ